MCCECKCTDMKTQGESTGVICFYLNGDDMDNHRSVIQFVLDHALIQKTKAGKLYNISFKFDDQTLKYRKMDSVKRMETGCRKIIKLDDFAILSLYIEKSGRNPTPPCSSCAGKILALCKIVL